ncbi:hypothetical protein NQ176_g7666 [Zarea fungicola]|uniref:Uncharacterized protein n=1 Tax=Zarea fungicola TaxID=93591 RepID=A0ACC1MXZ9_9HYPO|nr:hypothetical protein NQ176_g7666 [Lecanicillium fungicola]
MVPAAQINMAQDIDIDLDIDSDGDSDMNTDPETNMDAVPDNDIDMAATDSSIAPIEDTDMAVNDISTASAEDSDMTAADINIAPVSDTEMVVTDDSTIPVPDIDMAGTNNRRPQVAGSRMASVFRRKLTLTGRRRASRSCRPLSPTESLRQDRGNGITNEREKELLSKHSQALTRCLHRLNDQLKSAADKAPSSSRMRLLVRSLLHDIEYAEADKHDMERIAEMKICAALEWHKERARVVAAERRMRSIKQLIRATERRYSRRLRSFVGEEGMKNMMWQLLEDICGGIVPMRALEAVFRTRLSRMVNYKMDECGIEDCMEGLDLTSQ